MRAASVSSVRLLNSESRCTAAVVTSLACGHKDSLYGMLCKHVVAVSNLSQT